jgi:UDP-glucose 4-epimerase
LHFAAHINVEDSFSRPLNYYENNFVSLLNLLKMCQKYNVNNFVFSSTAAVYGDVRADKVDELHPTQPINPYGRSKLFAESLLQDFKNSNSEFEYVILRYFNVSGASDNGIIGQSTKGASNLIKIAVETAVGKRESLSIFGTDYSTIDGTCIRDFIHVDDLAEAHISSLDYLDSSARCSDVFNCGYGEGYSVREVVNSIKNISGIDFKVIECKRRIGDPQKVIADPSKIKNKLNWKPKKNDLELICKSAYLWEINKRY